ncbi:MAG TPA: class I SAM-dependent methyltransferase [Terriglobales bacterium]|jgi:ubiquinone/menaquinone biosynthesis C-methylase UbiE|nr:class I SAM-dependent methyltransferase [Terriglobales bacterium]
MAETRSATQLKDEVQNFWNAEPCGTRYLDDPKDFESHRQARYSLEPYIHDFARFSEAKDLRVLEIGVGMGSDYLEWLKAGAIASGVDLSAASIEQTRSRCQQAGYTADVQTGDAENLPFPPATFDLVYSYGVMHHSPNTERCVEEAWRVLKPGGTARIMVYHHPSLTGLSLWLRYGALRGKSLRRTVYEQLESPGTKTYTEDEARVLMNSFQDVTVRQVFSPGDLLQHEPSARFSSGFYRMVWKLYPRWLLEKIAASWGLFLLIEGKKPAA